MKTINFYLSINDTKHPKQQALDVFFGETTQVDLLKYAALRFYVFNGVLRITNQTSLKKCIVPL